MPSGMDSMCLIAACVPLDSTVILPAAAGTAKRPEIARTASNQRRMVFSLINLGPMDEFDLD